MADGETADNLARNLSVWRDRIRAVLRNDGLSAKEITRLSAEVETAIRRTLESPIGAWLLGSRLDAESERALTTTRAGAAQVRLDRIFRAGPEPESGGDSHLWIVDFKTASHAGEGLEDWLHDGKAKYREQMNTYASVFPGDQVNLALWYPMPARLLWWPA